MNSVKQTKGLTIIVVGHYICCALFCTISVICRRDMSQNSSYQNYMLMSTEGGNGHAYYKRKAGKGVKASVTIKLRKYNKILRKHVEYKQKKIVWRAN